MAAARQRAAALRQAVAAGDDLAALRCRRAAPEAAGAAIELAQAQHVVARESGFGDWPSLCEALDPERQAAEAALLDALLAGEAERAAAILQRWPDLPAQSLPCALALAAPEAARRIPKENINQALPPADLPPLMLVCASRHRGSGNEGDRLALAKALVDAGADVNVAMREAESIRGCRTALGAAIDCAKSPALAQLLLAAGADVADGPTLYEGSAMWAAVRHADVDSLKALLAAKPPQWHVCHALPHALRFNDLALTRLLLENDGDPNWTMGIWGCKGNCLHEAVMLDNDPAILEALLAHGATVDFEDRDRRTPLAVAACLHRDALAEGLRRHGAGDDRVRDIDRWVGACFAGDTERAHQLAAGLDKPELRGTDHLWVCRAVGRPGDAAPPALQTANNAALALLLAGGLDANAVDDDGEHALHLAAASNPAAVDILLAHGADPKAVNFRGETPLDVAIRLHQRESTRRLAAAEAEALTPLPPPALNAAFEAAADAVATGDLATLQARLRQWPQLPQMRSRRPHRCTLLNYLGANGFEHWRQRTPANAVTIVDCLLTAGADANAVCYTYRGGPGENALGLLTSSGHPRQAGLTLALVAALARGGARLDDVYRLLADLHGASEEDELANAAQALDAKARTTELAVVECAMLGETTFLFALLDAGANVDARRDDGATALHQAAIDGNERLVDALLARGASPSLRDRIYNGNAAGWANAGGHEALSRRLAQVAETEAPS